MYIETSFYIAILYGERMQSEGTRIPKNVFSHRSMKSDFKHYANATRLQDAY